MNSLTSTNRSALNLDDSLLQQETPVQFLPLDSELLLKRIKDGGHSGKFLADAFISSYRTQTLFKHSLGEITRLDLEAVRLFHQVLHLRFISGWSDAFLYELEQKVIQLGGES